MTLQLLSSITEWLKVGAGGADWECVEMPVDGVVFVPKLSRGQKMSSESQSDTPAPGEVSAEPFVSIKVTEV